MRIGSAAGSASGVCAVLRAGRAVWRLWTAGQQGRAGDQQQQQPLEHGIGSGIIISPDGYIVTNNHVVDGAVEMKVTLNDRRVLKAKLIGVDKLTDLAVIKVDATRSAVLHGAIRRR